jgi:two-component system, response regulator PdtaR
MGNPLNSRSKVNLSPHHGAIEKAVVLVVEDEFLIRIDISEALRAAGYKVVECSSADEALVLLCSGVLVDLVFTDIRMPGEMDGLDFAKWVQTERSNIPVIVTSAEQPRHDVNAPFIPKPYSHQNVIQRIRSSLGTSEGPPR